jgi:hypothetical protein
LIEELERALVQLGRELELPPTPDLAAAVAPRLRRRRRWWIAAVAVAAAVALAFAVPGSRAELLRFFHIGGETIQLVDDLPPLPDGRAELAGTPTTLEALPFRAFLPYGERPDAVLRFSPRGAWLVYGPIDRPRLLLAEFEPDVDFQLVVKKVAISTGAEWLRVGGNTALWIPGGRKHELFLPGGIVRYAGSTLVLGLNTLTIRIEGRLTKAEAIRVALALR